MSPASICGRVSARLRMRLRVPRKRNNAPKGHCIFTDRAVVRAAEALAEERHARVRHRRVGDDDLLGLMREGKLSTIAKNGIRRISRAELRKLRKIMYPFAPI